MKDQGLMVSIFLCAAFAASPLFADASPAALRNPPPECRPPASECGCPKGDVVQNGCEKLNADALARKLPLGSAARRKVIQVSGWLRRAARNPMVIAAGTASTAITIFEGYYDIGVMFYCCTTCFR